MDYNDDVIRNIVEDTVEVITLETPFNGSILRDIFQIQNKRIVVGIVKKLLSLQKLNWKHCVEGIPALEFVFKTGSLKNCLECKHLNHTNSNIYIKECGLYKCGDLEILRLIYEFLIIISSTNKQKILGLFENFKWLIVSMINRDVVGLQSELSLKLFKLMINLVGYDQHLNLLNLLKEYICPNGIQNAPLRHIKIGILIELFDFYSLNFDLVPEILKFFLEFYTTVLNSALYLHPIDFNKNLNNFHSVLRNVLSRRHLVVDDDGVLSDEDDVYSVVLPIDGIKLKLDECSGDVEGKIIKIFSSKFITLPEPSKKSEFINSLILRRVYIMIEVSEESEVCISILNQFKEEFDLDDEFMIYLMKSIMSNLYTDFIKGNFKITKILSTMSIDEFTNLISSLLEDVYGKIERKIESSRYVGKEVIKCELSQDFKRLIEIMSTILSIIELVLKIFGHTSDIIRLLKMVKTFFFNKLPTYITFFKFDNFQIPTLFEILGKILPIDVIIEYFSSVTSCIKGDIDHVVNYNNEQLKFNIVESFNILILEMRGVLKGCNGVNVSTDKRVGSECLEMIHKCLKMLKIGGFLRGMGNLPINKGEILIAIDTLINIPFEYGGRDHLLIQEVFIQIVDIRPYPYSIFELSLISKLWSHFLPIMGIDEKRGNIWNILMHFSTISSFDNRSNRRIVNAPFFDQLNKYTSRLFSIIVKMNLFEKEGEDLFNSLLKSIGQMKFLLDESYADENSLILITIYTQKYSRLNYPQTKGLLDKIVRKWNVKNFDLLCEMLIPCIE